MIFGTGFSVVYWIIFVIYSLIDYGFSSVVFVTCLFYLLNSKEVLLLLFCEDTPADLLLCIGLSVSLVVKPRPD